jgi:NAD(P)-dependent dehydrogenase (short-subunit alcohol dehydrogenase family)
MKSVLITGCSSGIGKETALYLARSGFLVFATVRREADAQKLREIGEASLVPLCPLDLNRLEHISTVRVAVQKELRARKMDGLFALVNNAGGGKPAPVELMDLEGFRSELNSRLLGSAALVQEFLPLLRQGHGRIVWIMTPAIIPTPFVAAIHACDFAANCLARTLNIELKKWKIANIMVRCGGIRTPAGLRTRADVEAVLKANVLGRMDLYQEAFRKWGEEMAEFDKKRTPPLQVARTIGKALAAKSPRKRYSLGYMSKAAAFLELLPQRLADWILSKRF